MIRVKSHIAAMAKYQPPWTGLDRSGYLRLDLNENTLDPPEHVKAALKAYIDDNRIQMYPEYERFMEKLSRYAGMAQRADHSVQRLRPRHRAFAAGVSQPRRHHAGGGSPSFPSFPRWRA